MCRKNVLAGKIKFFFYIAGTTFCFFNSRDPLGQCAPCYVEFSQDTTLHWLSCQHGHIAAVLLCIELWNENHTFLEVLGVYSIIETAFHSCCKMSCVESQEFRLSQPLKDVRALNPELGSWYAYRLPQLHWRDLSIRGGTTRMQLLVWEAIQFSSSVSWGVMLSLANTLSQRVYVVPIMQCKLWFPLPGDCVPPLDMGEVTPT